MEDKVYINEIFPVKLQLEDLDDLLNISSNVNGLINLVQGTTVASAKSVLGLFNINWTQPCKLLIQAYLNEDELSAFKKYKI